MQVYILIRKKPNQILDVFSNKEALIKRIADNPGNFYIIEKTLIDNDTKMKSIIEVDEKVYDAKHFNDIMPFGKYKNQLIGDIIQEDPAYLKWAMDNINFQLDEECIELIEANINKER